MHFRASHPTANASASIDYNNGTGISERSFTVSAAGWFEARLAGVHHWHAKPLLQQYNIGLLPLLPPQAADGLLPKACTNSTLPPAAQQREFSNMPLSFRVFPCTSAFQQLDC